MAKEDVKGMDFTQDMSPVDTGNPHGKRPADKSAGDKEADTSVAKKGKRGTDLPGTTMVGEEIAELFKDVDGLSEDFIDRATTILEAAISEKVSLVREEIEQEYADKLNEEVEERTAELEVRLSEYLELFTGNYLKENKVAIETGFKNDIAEQVIAAVNTIVESAGVELPEDKVDVADALAEANAELEEKYNKALNENISLSKEIKKYQLAEAFDIATSGLSEGTKDKLRRLTENMEFADVDQFNSKMEVLKESFTENNAPDAEVSQKDLTEATGEHNPAPQKTVDPKMQMYINATRGSFPRAK